MNERHAYKIPQLNKWGVIDSTVLEIEIPSTIDASFLNTIKSNPHAQYKYNNNIFALQEIKDNKYYFIRFFQGIWTETQSGSFVSSLQSGYIFIFNLPTEYSEDLYTIECFDYDILNGNPTTKIQYSGKDPIITKDGKKLTIKITSGNSIWYGGVTVSTKEDFALQAESLVLISGETITSSRSTYPLQGGGSTGGGIVIDEVLSESSTNPVQNKIITEELNKKANTEDISNFIAIDTLEKNTDNEHLSYFSYSEADNKWILKASPLSTNWRGNAIDFVATDGSGKLNFNAWGFNAYSGDEQSVGTISAWNISVEDKNVNTKTTLTPSSVELVSEGKTISMTPSTFVVSSSPKFKLVINGSQFQFPSIGSQPHTLATTEDINTLKTDLSNWTKYVNSLATNVNGLTKSVNNLTNDVSTLKQTTSNLSTEVSSLSETVKNINKDNISFTLQGKTTTVNAEGITTNSLLESTETEVSSGQIVLSKDGAQTTTTTISPAEISLSNSWDNLNISANNIKLNDNSFTFPSVGGMLALVDHIHEATQMYYEYHNSGTISLENCLITYITSNNADEKLSISNGTATDGNNVPQAEWYILMLPSKVFSPANGSTAKWTGIAIYPTKTLGISSVGSRQFNLKSGETFVKIQTGSSGASQWSLKKYI